MTPINLNQRCFCLISGASRGIGRSFAVELAKKFSSGSHLLLLARNSEQLAEVKRCVEEATSGEVNVTVAAIDLASPNKDQLREILTKAGSSPLPFDLAICIHNVGTIGDIETWTADESIDQKWSDYFQVNLFQVIVLNHLFLELTKASAKQRLVVNVTSLCAIEPMSSLGYYCTGKAAREMFFKVLAKENPQVTVLNYSPGMVDTEMAAELRTKAADEGLREFCKESFEKKELLTPMQTTNRMIEVLEKGAYESGDHVDYHDK